jgi:hypothetical protein
MRVFLQYSLRALATVNREGHHRAAGVLSEGRGREGHLSTDVQPDGTMLRAPFSQARCTMSFTLRLIVSIVLFGTVAALPAAGIGEY